MMSSRQTFGRKQIVGSFHIGCLLEEKATTQVWSGMEEGSGKGVVVKICNDKESMEREVAILTSLRGVYTPTVLESGESMNRFYFAMNEFCRTIEQFLQLNDNRQFICCNIIMILTQLFSALEFLNKQGFMHGHIAPQHVMISKPNGSDNNVLVKLIGIGNAQKLEIVDSKVIAVEIDIGAQDKKWCSTGTLMSETLKPVDEIHQTMYLCWLMNNVGLEEFEAPDGGFEHKLNLSLNPLKMLPRPLKWMGHLFCSLDSFDSETVPNYAVLKKAATLCVRDFNRTQQLQLVEEEGILVLQ